ncbi:MAG: hypothetical protein WAU36_11190 [Cyclobacteriaceae bacterium]
MTKDWHWLPEKNKHNDLTEEKIYEPRFVRVFTISILAFILLSIGLYVARNEINLIGELCILLFSILYLLTAYLEKRAVKVIIDCKLKRLALVVSRFAISKRYDVSSLDFNFHMKERVGSRGFRYWRLSIESDLFSIRLEGGRGGWRNATILQIAKALKELKELK